MTSVNVIAPMIVIIMLEHEEETRLLQRVLWDYEVDVCLFMGGSVGFVSGHSRQTERSS